MTAPEGPTYFRPINADTGEPTLAVYFTAILFDLLSAYEHDIDKQTDELAADVRDELDRRGIPIRPTINRGSLRVLQETEPDENGINQPPMVHSTVVAYLTDAEPSDPRLTELLADGFYAERVDAHVTFTIPTEESEADAIAEDRRSAAAAQEYNAKADSERAAAAEREAKAAADPFGKDVIGDMGDLFD